MSHSQTTVDYQSIHTSGIPGSLTPDYQSIHTSGIPGSLTPSPSSSSSSSLSLRDRTDYREDRTAVRTGNSPSDHFTDQDGGDPVSDPESDPAQVAKVVQMTIMNALDLSTEFEKDTGISASPILPKLRSLVADGTITNKGLSECLIEQLDILFESIVKLPMKEFLRGYTHAFALTIRTALFVADRKLHDDWIGGVWHV